MPLLQQVAIIAAIDSDQYLTKRCIMPSGKGTYGSKVGRPKKKKRKTKK